MNGSTSTTSSDWRQWTDLLRRTVFTGATDTGSRTVHNDDMADIRTTRLRLRRPGESDIDAIVDACQDPEIQRFTLTPVPYRRTDAEHFVRVVAAHPRSSVWTIRTLLDDTFVGVAGLRVAGGVGTLGYWCAAPQRGRGYLGEAVAALVDHGFSAVGVDTIRWSALPDNVASARLAAALGFRYTGRRTETAHGLDEQVNTAELSRSDPREPRVWPETVVGPNR